LKKLLIEAAMAAGKEILKVYNTADFGVEMKGDNSPLTKADKAAHVAIMGYLNTTGIPVLSEEGASISYQERSKWNEFWMVDPLDGTKEFIKKNGEFTVNIALIKNGKPTFGVVYVPVTGELFIGGVSNPAVKIVNGTENKLQEKDNTTALTALENKTGIRVVASRSHLNSDTEAFMNRLNNPVIVSMGSSLKFMAIADNKADVYPRFAPTMEWDTAAAHAVLNSLGIKVLQQNSSDELVYNKENLLNPYFICY
jgi:3'(2'), 5'-bisphosphate nucleotidase